MGLGTLKQKVEHCLINYPETRNDDMMLTFYIIRDNFPDRIKLIEDEWFISTKALRIIREDNVKRIRAKFNSVGLYLPTDSETIKQRGINKIKWERHLSYG